MISLIISEGGRDVNGYTKKIRRRPLEKGAVVMTKKELIYGLLAGEPMKTVPTGFWLHFPESWHHGDAAIKAHMDFVRDTGVDILKVMNENILCDGESRILSTADIGKFHRFSRGDKVFTDQMDIIKRIADQASGEYPILATIHGLVASVFHATGFGGNYVGMGYGLSVFCREKPQQMRDVMRMFTDTLMELVECSLEAGADGIFYAALGGERNWFFHDEYMEHVGGFERELYEYIKKKTPFNVLHICKSNIDFTRFTDLAPAVVNWSVHHNNVSLTQGAEMFPGSVILGGFEDRSGVLVDGSPDQIREKTREILSEMAGRRFILGSDCTLPTQIATERIRCAVEAAKL